MQPLLGKLAAVAVLVGGFAATGDLRRLTDRGWRLLNATTVPAGHEPAAAAQPAQPPHLPAASARPAQPPHLPAVSARPPAGSPGFVDLPRLRPGARLVVWAGSPPAPVAFDLVDPAAGEVLEAGAGASSGGPRRLRLEGDAVAPGRVSVGATLRLVPLGIAHGGGPAAAETLGPVRGLEIP
ncbi:MAG: hypothetical protein EBZ74_12060 [Planctomycetia bacterium]|nr:hypothetical protein [Planctomycetia bacterium]